MTIKTFFLRTFWFFAGLTIGILFVMYVRSPEISFLPIMFSHHVDETPERATVEPTIGNTGDAIPSVEALNKSSQEILKPTESTVPGEAAFVAESSDDLNVQPQAAGLSVVVAHVRILESGGWLAIREFKNGVPGSVLGARRLLGGSIDTVEVSLLRTTVSGNTYLAQVYTDDGNSSFDIGIDIPVADRKPVQFLVQ